MKQRRYPTLVVLLILGGIVLAGNSVFDFKLAFNKGVANTLSSFASGGDLQTRIESLERENTDLRAQLFRQDLLPTGSAVVYSSYPFNSKSELIIGQGVQDGVAVGDTILSGNSVLVGRVREVSEDKSVVTTIFDPGFETAVRIGDQEIDALMRGGNELLLDLIPTDAEVEAGQSVVTAGSELPYGLHIGIVKEVKEAGGSVFKKALVEPGFEVKALRNVNILN
ncbi:MAG: rod shape-determining protein MreC [bacterium]|nr:rod shape-determining protein MreC [bacterium]MDZ4231578.1 rod shape-determining protein MreC [Patescibacteria group bacterium]